LIVETKIHSTKETQSLDGGICNSWSLGYWIWFVAR